MNVGVIIGIVCGAIGVVAIGVLLYIFVISKKNIKKQIKELERKYSYLNALLIGQDSQYIKRLEIISHTNLLYVDKHETFSKRFKDIFDNDDHYAQNVLKKLNTLVNNKQYRNIKNILNDAKQCVAILESHVNELDSDLYELIKLEENSRQTILKLKENYRVVKQNFYTSANDIELTSASFMKAFDKLDSLFAEFEEHIESAEYDEANILVAKISKVIMALDQVISALPNLCSIVQQIIPKKLANLESLHQDVINLGVPLYHLGYESSVNKWKDTLNGVTEDIKKLSIHNASSTCDQIISSIDEMEALLEGEAADKKYFEETSDELYAKVKNLDDGFLKIIAILPEINNVYLIDAIQKQNIEDLKCNINQLWATKRTLDGFIHSETKQPFSVLKVKLDTLASDYEVANEGLKDFKAYLESLKSASEEAYSLIFIYFHRTKQIENALQQIAIPSITDSYQNVFDEIYSLLNVIDKALKVKPIDVNYVKDNVESLKNLANDFFTEVENKYRLCKMAESAIVYANRDRIHQNDVHQQLLVLEQGFNNGDFEKVYNDANAIFSRTHVEDASHGS